VAHLPKTVLDHRGRRVPLHNPGSVGDLVSAREQRFAAALADMRRRSLEDSRSDRTAYRVLMVVLSLVAGYLLVAGVTSLAEGNSITLIMVGPVVVFIVFMMWHARRVWPFEGPRALVRGLVGEGLCPSCTYSIEGLTPEGDGCVVCPECGAAWRVGDS
jgi:hypothetical protein